MNLNVAKREFNAIKKLIEDRDKFNEKHEKLQWDEARRKALRKKRADIRKREKEAKKAADKTPKAGPRSKTVAPEARSTGAPSTSRTAAASAVRALFQHEFDFDPDDPPLRIDETPRSNIPETGQDDVQEADADDVEEVIIPRPSSSRSKPAPEPGTLSKTPRRQRVYLPDTDIESRFGVILGEVKSIWKELNSIKGDSERELSVSFGLIFMASLSKLKRHCPLQKIANNTKANTGALDLLAKDLGEMKIRMFKQDMRQEMTMAKAERNVTRFLPIDMINETTRSLLGEDPSARAICSRVWNALHYAGYEDPDLGAVVSKAAVIVFSNDLRAFMKVSDGSG